MGISPSECAKLSFWEYGALMHGWNKAHDPDGDLPKIDVEDMEKRIEHLLANPEMLK